MVGKLSDDRKMSGSRIPVLYLWRYGDGHPYSTPNEELRRSIDAKTQPVSFSDIGEPGIVGNLLEPALALSAADELGIPDPDLTPPVIRTDTYEVSCDAISELTVPVDVEANDLIQILDLETGESLPSVRLIGNVPIEVKCTADYAPDTPPLYRGPIQLQMQMMATGAQFGVLISLHRGIERRITIYTASPTIQTRIDELCDEFLERAAAEDYYPPVTVSDATQAPASDEKTERDIGDKDETIDRLLELQAQRSAIDDEIERLQVEIMDAIGDAHIGTTPTYRVEWPVRHYKAQPEKVTPAKEARTIRLKTLKIKATM